MNKTRRDRQLVVKVVKTMTKALAGTLCIKSTFNMLLAFLINYRLSKKDGHFRGFLLYYKNKRIQYNLSYPTIKYFTFSGFQTSAA